MEPDTDTDTFPNDASSLSQPLIPSQRSLPTPSSSSSSSHLPWRSKSNLHRASTAPAISILTSPKASGSLRTPNTSSSVIQHAFLYLLAYISIGVTVYCLAGPDSFTGQKTNFCVDAVYFCIVTLCTIGYGDIAPATGFTKAFACLFVLVGFGLIDVLLSGAVSYMLDAQEAAILAGARGGVFVDPAKGRMRIRMKPVGLGVFFDWAFMILLGTAKWLIFTYALQFGKFVTLAVSVVVLCIGFGAIALYFIENLSWIDSLYLAVTSVTTVGYGDKAFKTLYGRVFASVWLLVSTLAVARAFLFLAEARIDKRHRRIVKWILHRDLTVDDLLAADLNRNGFISKSEFVIHKLKEMGKIGEKDVLLILQQFDKHDTNHTGKITLPGLLSANR